MGTTLEPLFFHSSVADSIIEMIDKLVVVF